MATELKNLTERLEAALEADEPSALREAAGALLDAVREVEELERAARLIDIGHQASALIHELRQPLLGIKGFAQMIEANPDDADKVESRAAVIVTQCDRITEMAERVRAYVRGEPPTGDPVTADANQIVGEVVALLANHLQKLGVSVTMELASNLPQVSIRPGELQQVLINLIRNSGEAVDPGGSVTVETKASAKLVEVIVRDDGPGIPDAVRDKLFTRFTSSKESGTGLGLHISRSIAERASGTLEALDVDSGAAFSLRLPRR